MLALSNITVRLGGRTIIDDATARLPTRGRIGLIGRNGAGKTTLVRVITGLIEPDAGGMAMPRGTRLGYLAQEAPAGEATPFDTVLAADVERSALMAEAEDCADPDRLGDLYERLIAIDAYTAPARAAQILVEAQPDVLLLDEPSNHLDLEAVLWLEDFLRSYPATILLVSHERDFLNNVVDHVLHLQHGKLTLYPGGYDAFEKQRAERQAQLASARERQEAERAKLQDYVARNSARASTAKQAQSRAKMLARMQPIAELIDDPSLQFDFPDPDELRPPLITLDLASVGYDETPILRRLNLRLDPDDRIALLGRNGNGKTTLARLLAAQLAPLDGAMNASGRMRVGYFTQYQVEELQADETPLQHMTQVMPGASPSAVRAQLGRFGFTGQKAMTEVGRLSGGERARLALALITRDAPHLLILDEPTNHLDVDAREALIQALNAYGGAVVLVSHDRHMIELTADRLVLVDAGTAREYDGSLDDYIAFVLAKPEAKPKGGAAKKAPLDRDKVKELRRAAITAEAELARLTDQRATLDRSLADPAARERTGELMRHRATLDDAIEQAEHLWLQAAEALDAAAA